MAMRSKRWRGRLLATLALGVLAAWRAQATAAPAGPPPPARLEIEPNAIQDPSQPMAIEVGGIPEGETVRLQVFRDCNDAGEPDPQRGGGCAKALYDRVSRPAGKDRTVRDQIDFADAVGKTLPTDTVLWLRASRSRSARGRSVRFGLVKDPCSLWQGVVGTFFGGKCDPHLRQALLTHRGLSSLGDTVFEVRRLDPAAAVPGAVPVAGTRGATGVAWLDRDTLLVTLAPTAAESGSLAPGLWRVPLTGKPEALWPLPGGDGWVPAAPLALPGGRIAFARQRGGLAAGAEEGTLAYLSVWDKGKVDAGIELPYRIHQLVAHDAAGNSLLALTLGAGNSRPAFLQIDLRARTVQYLGYDRCLYQAAMRSPHGDDSAIAMEEISGKNGWDLVLVDGRGHWKRDLQARPEDDLLPAWRPDGGEIAFLAEIQRTGGPR
jgi:hypothetical protein